MREWLGEQMLILSRSLVLLKSKQGKKKTKQDQTKQNWNKGKALSLPVAKWVKSIFNVKFYRLYRIF